LHDRKKNEPSFLLKASLDLHVNDALQNNASDNDAAKQGYENNAQKSDRNPWTKDQTLTKPAQNKVMSMVIPIGRFWPRELRVQSECSIKKITAGRRKMAPLRKKKTKRNKKINNNIFKQTRNKKTKK